MNAARDLSDKQLFCDIISDIEMLYSSCQPGITEHWAMSIISSALPSGGAKAKPCCGCKPGVLGSMSSLAGQGGKGIKSWLKFSSSSPS